MVGLRITPSPGTGAPGGDIGVIIEKWQVDPARPLTWWRPEPTHVTDSAVLPPLRAYERSAAALPASLQDGLRELASLVGSRRSVRVSLDIDPALERMPWEALLSYPVLTGGSTVPGALDFWRRGEPLAGTGRPGRPRPPGTVAVLADTTHRLFAERAELARSLSFPDLSASGGDDVNRVIERAGAQATDPPDIVLVIGRPVRMRGAVLLQTAEQATARGTSGKTSARLSSAAACSNLRSSRACRPGCSSSWGRRARRAAASIPSAATPPTCVGGRPTSFAPERRR